MSQTSIPQEGSAKPQAGRNQRATVRYRCAPATAGKVLVENDHEFKPAWVVNLSSQGVGLQIQSPVEIGAPIQVQIRSFVNSRLFKLHAQVAHCSQNHHGEWHLGCEFITPLTPDELDDLLG